jgi:hypothetical protein
VPLSVKEKEWAKRASLFLKVELKRAGMTYEDLAVSLKEQGVSETGASIANKLSRGTFSAIFFMASMAAIGIDEFRVNN